jgi:putative transposase
MISSAVMFGPLRAGHASQVPGSLTVSWLRPQKKGGRGVDGYKQVKWRKRQIFIDTLGLLLTVVVTAATVQEREGAHHLVEVHCHRFSRFQLIWADQAYTSDLAAWVWALRPWPKVRLEVVKRLDGRKGFHVLPKRWTVERCHL